MKKVLIGLLALVIIITTLVALMSPAGLASLAAQGDPADTEDSAGATPVATTAVQPETCAICHNEGGARHQASYDELYQDGVIQVTDLDYSFSSPDTSTVTFKMTKDGAPFDARDADALSIYFAEYSGTDFPGTERMSLLGTLSYDSEEGVSTSTVEGIPDLSELDGLIAVYGRDEVVARLPNSRVYQNKYPFAGLLETGDGVDYVSAANNDGCERCHTVPYLKHSYIYGQVDGDATTDMYVCKVCHLDNGEGGHFEWQLLVDDPALAVGQLADEENFLSAEQKAQYAYKTSLMNDVHMSHAMEFPYPQSMSNCVACHEGKLDVILADENFTTETCKSCHPVTGSEEYGTEEFAIKTLLPSIHDDMDLDTEDCIRCHGEGKMASTFSEIHSGYDTTIYADEDLRYSDSVVVTVDDASIDDNKLTIKFSADEATDLEDIDVEDIVPTVLVGLYGWDTKDFIIGPHERLIDDNGDGEISGSSSGGEISESSGDERVLEYVVGAEHPRYTTESAAGGSWEVVADLSSWADLIDDGTVKRAEIAVIPELENADGVIVSLNAPSRTFDLGANDFDDEFYGPIVKVEDGCNNCHEALATNYHSADRGGNIVVCRMCHITKSDASHLELQSRSLDSYIHAIHSFQPFDVGDIDFEDPVEALHYEHHIGFPYPTHAITNCESCHVEGTYEAPDQLKSLPGILSATDPVEDRNIGDIPLYITGPATRACGGCHRAELINEDDVVGLVVLNQHLKQGGYLIEGGDDDAATLQAVIDEVMALFR